MARSTVLIPTSFFFDAEGHMVLSPPASQTKKEKADAVLAAKVSDTIECVADKGVEHHSRPQLHAILNEPKRVKFGQQLVIKKRCAEWVQDNIGWLPLIINELAVFQIVRLATPTVAVMGRDMDDPLSP